MAALECKLSLSLITKLPIFAAPAWDKRRGFRVELDFHLHRQWALGSFSISCSRSGKSGEESCKDKDLTKETGKPSMIWVWTVPPQAHVLEHLLTVLAGCGTLGRNIRVRGSGLLGRVYRIYGLCLQPTSYPLSTHDLLYCMYVHTTELSFVRPGRASCPPPLFYTHPIFVFSSSSVRIPVPACASAFTVHGHDPDSCLSSLEHSGLLCVCTDSALLKGHPWPCIFPVCLFWACRLPQLSNTGRPALSHGQVSHSVNKT